MILRCLAPRDLARLRDLARREGTTADTLARIAVRQLLQASGEWDGVERRRQERRRMDLETVTAKVTRPRNRMGGPPWSPETRARYTATIAANRAARAPVGHPTDRGCATPECPGRVPLRFKGQGPQRRDCDACRALRTTGRRRSPEKPVSATPLCACGRPAAPRTTGRRPTLCPACKAQRAQDRWRANKRKARGLDLDTLQIEDTSAFGPSNELPEQEVDEDAEDIEALLDTTYPADIIERRAKSPVRRRAADRPGRERVQTEGPWWMQAATVDGFTALAESRMAEMAKGKGAKIASQMEVIRRGI